MIPTEHREVVLRSLKAAFGTTSYEPVELLAGGFRAVAARIVVARRHYVLRIGASAMIDPAVEQANVRAGAEAGLAPRIAYASVEDRVIISDYVARATPPPDLGVVLGRTIARIHALPPWPRAIHHLDTLERFLARLGARPELEDLTAKYADLARVYPRDRDLVPCHNDLKPENLVWDGARLWILDWEAAFVNDRYADLGYAGALVVISKDEERQFLSAYFGREASEYERARWYLATCAIHLAFVALVSLVPPDEVKRRMADQHLSLGRERMRSPRFDEAIARVASAA